MKELELIFKNIRPRSKQNGYGRKGRMVFMKKGYREWKEELAYEAQQQALTQGWELNKTDALCASWEFFWPYPVADIDNIKTGILDALENVIFLDDCQFDTEEKTRLRIRPEKYISLFIRAYGPSEWVTRALERKNRRAKK